MSNRTARVTAIGTIAVISVQFGSIHAQTVDKQRELILFGANWCAPCRAELKDLDRMAARVAPDHLVVAWLDAPPRLSKKRLPANARVVSGLQARTLLNSFDGVGAGVPLAVMRDRQDNVCAVIKRRVRPADLAKILNGCRQ